MMGPNQWMAVIVGTGAALFLTAYIRVRIVGHRRRVVKVTDPDGEAHWRIEMPRDRADGQTGLSRWLQNGLVDPATAFHRIRESGGEAATPLLRQLCFREAHIRRSRSLGLTMEDGAERWAESLLDVHSLEHFHSHRGTRNPMATLSNLGKAMTGDALVDRIMRWSLRHGTMPNRARMYFASWCYRNSATPAESFELCSSVFDLLLLDGQCPTNYVQNAEALQLKYGRVTPFRADTAEAKLWPIEAEPRLF